LRLHKEGHHRLLLPSPVGLGSIESDSNLSETAHNW
jgi:hypothetical protein